MTFYRGENMELCPGDESDVRALRFAANLYLDISGSYARVQPAFNPSFREYSLDLIFPNNSPRVELGNTTSTFEGVNCVPVDCIPSTIECMMMRARLNERHALTSTNVSPSYAAQILDEAAILQGKVATVAALCPELEARVGAVLTTVDHIAPAIVPFSAAVMQRPTLG